MLRRAEALCFRLARLLAAAGLMLLIGFAAATLLDGLLRSLANRPIDAVGDLGSLVVAAAVSACFPLAQLQRANITIELAGLALGPRAGQALRAFAAILVTIAMTAMARQLFVYAGNEASGGDTTVMLGIRTAPFWYVVASMFFVAAAAQLLVTLVELGHCRRPGQASPLSGAR